jgi:transposase
MAPKRYELSERQWVRIAPLIAGKASDPGRTGVDNRLFVNAVLWVIRSGAHWHDLPERYGKYKSVHKRFTRWAKAGVWERTFEALTSDPDNQYLMLDSTIVRAHQQAASGKRGGKNQALGRSRGGLTTKIHTLADAEGRPLRFILTGGEAHDVTTAADLLDGQTAGGVIADKAYDTNDLRQMIEEADTEVIIPSKRNRKIQIPHDAQAYKLRNRIERFFNKLKHFRRIATRYDRQSIYFLAAIHLASCMIWMR